MLSHRHKTRTSYEVFFSLLIGLVISCQRAPGKDVPEEVIQFRTSRDLCDHYRGEEGYDVERRKFLLEQMKMHCTGTDEKLRSLKLKYTNNRTVVESLKKYQERIE